MSRSRCGPARLRPISGILLSAACGAGLCLIVTGIALVVILGPDESRSTGWALVPSLLVFVYMSAVLSVEVSSDGIVVRNTLSKHSITWSEIYSLSESWWYRSPGFVGPAVANVLLVTTHDGRRIGIDASPGNIPQLLGEFGRCAPGGTSQIEQLQRPRGLRKPRQPS